MLNRTIEWVTVAQSPLRRLRPFSIISPIHWSPKPPVSPLVQVTPLSHTRLRHYHLPMQMPTNRLTRRLIYRPVCLFSNTIHTTVLPHLNNSINARVVACLLVVTGEVRRPRRPQAARLVGTVWATTPWLSLITVPFSQRGCNSKHQLSRELLFPVKFRTIHSVVDGYYFSSLILHQKAFHKLYSCWTVERFRWRLG